MSRRARSVVPMVAVVVGLLTACSSSSTLPLATTAPTDPLPSPTRQVSDLVGNWTVTGTDVEPGTIATVDSYEVRIWTSCGLTYASYRADRSGLFAGSVDAWSGDCGADQVRPSWVVGAHRWGDDDGRVVLMDERGARLAVLESGGTPTTGPDVLDTQGSPPVLRPEDKERLDADPALPVGLRPATPADLVGAWVAERFAAKAAGSTSGLPGATIEADGSWTGYDGCNDGRGSWTSGPDGRFVATVGPMTAVGCDGEQVPGAMAAAYRAGLDGDVLVLVGATGEEDVRLVRVTVTGSATSSP